jgi:pyruvate kinase
MVVQVEQQLLSIERVEEGQRVVIVAGSPPGIAGSTNALRVHVMGDAGRGLAPAYREAETPFEPPPGA